MVPGRLSSSGTLRAPGARKGIRGPQYAVAAHLGRIVALLLSARCNALASLVSQTLAKSGDEQFKF